MPTSLSLCPPKGCRTFEICSRKGREPNSVVVERERSVNVLHERIAEYPDIIPKPEVLARNRTNTIARAARSLAEVEAARTRS